MKILANDDSNYLASKVAVMKSALSVLVIIFVILALTPPAQAAEVACPSGKLGSGGNYTAPYSYCLDGMILGKDQKYCPPGKLSSGGIYSHSHAYCLDGAILGLDQKHCPSGKLSGGGIYTPSNAYCLEGAILGLNQKHCPPGELAGGGIYTPSNAYCLDGAILGLNQKYCTKGNLGYGGTYNFIESYCLEGLILSKNASYCPKDANSSGRIYYPANEKCNSFSNLSGAAQILSVSGDVFLVDKQGGRRKISSSDAIAEGDIISTSRNGRITAYFKDQSKLQLLPNSDFKVTESKFNTNGCTAANDCRSRFEFLKGSLRWISGKLLSRDGFNLKTASLAMGIRGTDFEVFHIGASNPVPNVQPGTFVRLNEGNIYVDTNVQHLEIKAGEIVYVRDLDSKPTLINELPSELQQIN